MHSQAGRKNQGCGLPVQCSFSHSLWLPGALAWVTGAAVTPGVPRGRLVLKRSSVSCSAAGTNYLRGRGKGRTVRALGPGAHPSFPRSQGLFLPLWSDKHFLPLVTSGSFHRGPSAAASGFSPVLGGEHLLPSRWGKPGEASFLMLIRRWVVLLVTVDDSLWPTQG